MKTITNSHQFAFRRGRGVDTYFAALEKDLRKPFDEGEHCELLSIDLQKAYDRADRNQIVAKLTSWGVNGKMLNFIKSFLSNRSFRVLVGDVQSTRRTQETGVPQGSILSVSLFLVLMETVFEKIPKGIRIFVYADDVVLLAIDKDPKLARQKIQKAASTLGLWAEQTKMIISAEKSSCMHICRKRKHPAVPPIEISSTVVPEVAYTRILGVIIDKRLNFKRHIAAVRTNVQTVLNFLKVIGNRMNGGTRKTMLQVTKAMLLPKIFFCINFINSGSVTNMKRLLPLFNAGVRESSGVFRSSPIESIMAEAGQLPFEYTLTLTEITKAIRLLERDTKLFPENYSQSQSITTYPSVEKAKKRL